VSFPGAVNREDDSLLAWPFRDQRREGLGLPDVVTERNYPALRAFELWYPSKGDLLRSGDIAWLDLGASQKEHPNENFARELMELFTLGEGHYTEDDVKTAARAFTGYRVAGPDDQFRFVANQFDPSEKTFLGQNRPVARRPSHRYHSSPAAVREIHRHKDMAILCLR
jgi:hypothetical protein